jgi:dihydroorotate dehydrogenase (fumarate)
MMYGRIPVDFAMTGGVHTGIDVLKAMMAGASVTTLASELLQKGVNRVAGILQEMTTWMEEKEYPTVQMMQGSMSQKSVAEPGAFERVNYMKVLSSY